VIIEESKRGPWNRSHTWLCPWYAFVSQETYDIRLSSITEYDSAPLYSQPIMKKIWSINEVIFVNLYRLSLDAAGDSTIGVKVVIEESMRGNISKTPRHAFVFLL
jgi:hypothetical protein